jgi:glycosyltransferase involved in cell wall biosynthesis
MGGTKEPEKVYNLGDIVAFSSITEGFPFAVIEAMACGKAVVASNVGGVGEALDGCGVLVRSRRPRELANGIVTLLEDEQLRKKLGELAIKKARNEFTIEKTIEQIKKQYLDLINSFEVKKKELPEVVMQ